MPTRVMDSSSLLVFLEDVEGADKVEVLLGRAVDGRYRVVVSALALPVLYAHLTEKVGKRHARGLVAQVTSLPVEIASYNGDLDTAEAVGLLRRSCGLSLEEGHSAVLALNEGAILVTGKAAYQAVGGKLRMQMIEEGKT